jgi:broad specificity phosphatase PhoE
LRRTLPKVWGEMTTLYLVRHAHAHWQPSEDRALSKHGSASALALAERFDRITLTAIYSSPARRARQTVEPLARRHGLSPVVLQDLRERELATATAGEFETAVRSTWQDPTRAYGDGESNATAQGRGIALVRRLLQQHRDAGLMLATHGNLLALIVNAFDPAFGYDFWCTLSFPDVYELSFRGDALTGIRRAWEQSA